MLEKIDELLEKIHTQEELLFFLQQIDFAHSFLAKAIKEEDFSLLREKISSDLFLALDSIKNEEKKRVQEQALKKKEEMEKKEKEMKERLEIILEKEKEVEREIERLEKKENELRGTEREREIEQERWRLEEERIKIEKEKWEIKEQIKKIQEEREQKEEINLRPLLFFLEQLRKSLLSLPVINLEIAFNPEKETIEKIYQWFLKSLKQKVILNFKINPRIIGGLILEYQGKIWDDSLREKIKREIQSQKR